jgi:hypothetical protein
MPLPQQLSGRWPPGRGPPETCEAHLDAGGLSRDGKLSRVEYVQQG